MELTTLCYIEKDGKYLMLHRVSKKNDVNQGKWIGVGGHFELGESPEECVLREVKEETGLTLTGYRFRGLLTFLCDGNAAEYICIYTADGFEGELTACDEGKLAWIDKKEILGMELWEGDRIFHQLLEEDGPFFSLKFCYENDVLTEAWKDGKQMELLDVLNPDGTLSGRRSERGVVHQEGYFHRTVDIWVVRKKSSGGYDILLQKRAKEKKAYPGCYDTSAAGHVQAGDGILESARRELEEELGIHAEASELSLMGTHEAFWHDTFGGKAFHNHELSSIYLLEKEVSIEEMTLQEAEVESVCWMDLDACLEQVKEGSRKSCLNVERLELLKKFLEQKNG